MRGKIRPSIEICAWEGAWDLIYKIHVIWVRRWDWVKGIVFTSLMEYIVDAFTLSELLRSGILSRIKDTLLMMMTLLLLLIAENWILIVTFVVTQVVSPTLSCCRFISDVKDSHVNGLRWWLGRLMHEVGVVFFHQKCVIERWYEYTLINFRLIILLLSLRVFPRLFASATARLLLCLFLAHRYCVGWTGYIKRCMCIACILF